MFENYLSNRSGLNFGLTCYSVAPDAYRSHEMKKNWSKIKWCVSCDLKHLKTYGPLIGNRHTSAAFSLFPVDADRRFCTVSILHYG